MTDEREIEQEHDDGLAELQASDPEGSTAEEQEAAGAQTDASVIEAGDYKHKFLRAMADLDNLRKRMSREIGLRRRREREMILREFVAVIDNLERALDNAGAESSQWLEGVSAIRTQMLEVLKKCGAGPFHSTGEKFDPARHEAIATIKLPDKPEGTIADEVEIGYEMEDGAVLRPARVIVVTHA